MNWDQRAIIIAHLLPPLLLCVLLPKYGFAQVPESELFPLDDSPEWRRFGFRDDETFQVDFKVPFNFFNGSYPQTFLSGNGQISFIRGISAYTPHCTPRDTPMIMPYWADGVNGNVWFRETFNRTLLRKASRDVLHAFPKLRGIELTWMFIVLWKDIPFYGSSARCDGLNKRNTFQLAITSDGTHSFAIMYYNKIEWTTGSSLSSGGDCQGLGGQPAKAGFDFGDQKTLFTVPGSCTSSILNITQSSNIHQPGKWVFRIDSNLDAATCESFDESTDKLKIHPAVVSLLGNVPIKLEGPCLNSSANVTCTFHDVDKTTPLKTTMRGEISLDPMTVICPTPYFYGLGRLKVELTLEFLGNGSENSTQKTYFGYIYTVDEAIVGEHVDFSLDVLEDNTTLILSASWDASYFEKNYYSKSELDSIPQPIYVDLLLESYDGSKWKEMGILASSILNNGSFQGPVNQQLLERAFSKDQLDVMVISLVKSAPVPTGGNRAKRETPGFFGKMKAKLFSTLKAAATQLFKAMQYVASTPGDALCRTWHHYADPPPKDTFACPPTLEEADEDDDFEDDEVGKYLSWFHPGAKYSKRQKIPSRSGAGSQCVYDEGGNIMSGPPGGGTLDRYSPNYNKWDHFWHDVYPYLMCCRASGIFNTYNCNERYYDKRPSDNGTNYAHRRVARAVGDPHITTFDGLVYTFNGVGEFWMVKLENEEDKLSFKMQARMEQYVSSDGRKTPASVFTAMVMEEERSGNGDKSRIQVSYVDDKILVSLNDDPVDLDDFILASGMPIRHGSAHVAIISPGEVIVTFSCGFSFNFTTVGPNEIALNLIGTAHQKLANLTEGLMGNFDRLLENEMTRPDGFILPTNSTPEEIHFEFGLFWMVWENESIFAYPPGKSYSDFCDATFQPTFMMAADIRSLPQNIVDTCDGYMDCIFDYVTTGSEAIAGGTKDNNVAFEQTVEVFSKQVKMCKSSPPPVENGFFHTTTAIVGGTVNYECYPGFVLKNDLKVNCTCTDSADQSVEEEEEPQWICSNGNAPVICETEKELVCNSPPTPKYGYVIGKDYSLGASVEFQCTDKYELFWRNCKFNGEAGICKEFCNVTYTCVKEETTDEDGNVHVQAVWRGYAGDINNVVCSSEMIGKLATFLRLTSLVVHMASEGKLVPKGTKPYLVGC